MCTVTDSTTGIKVDAKTGEVVRVKPFFTPAEVKEHYASNRKVIKDRTGTCEEGQHNWRFVGFYNASPKIVVESLPAPDESLFTTDRTVRVVKEIRLVQTETCSNPVKIVCIECELEIKKDCGARSAKACEPCALRHEKKVRAVARLPLLIARPGSVLLITLTAPGERRHCVAHQYIKDGQLTPSYRCYEEGTKESIQREHEECPCVSHNVVNQQQIAEFNSAVVTKFNNFITKARRSKKLRGWRVGRRQAEYFRSLEPQKRGALHAHCLVRLPGLAIVDSEMRDLLREFAMMCGFGHQVDIQVIGEGGFHAGAAANYVSKYILKTESASVQQVPYQVCNKKHVDLTKYDQELEEDNWEHTGWEDHGTHACVMSSHATGELVPCDVCHVPMEEHRAPRRPRAWTASRGWGLSLGQLTIVQCEYVRNRALYELLTDTWQERVHSHQRLTWEMG